MSIFAGIDHFIAGAGRGRDLAYMQMPQEIVLQVLGGFYIYISDSFMHIFFL